LNTFEADEEAALLAEDILDMPDEATEEAEEVIEDATEEASEEAELITEEASDELLRIALDATEPEADPDEVGPAAPVSEPTPQAIV